MSRGTALRGPRNTESASYAAKARSTYGAQLKGRTMARSTPAIMPATV